MEKKMYRFTVAFDTAFLITQSIVASYFVWNEIIGAVFFFNSNDEEVGAYSMNFVVGVVRGEGV